MELLVILSSLCVCLSLLVKPCAASSSQEIFVLHEQQSNKELASSKEILFPRTSLPRKLRILQEPVKDSRVQGSSISYNEQTKPNASGKPHKRQQNVARGRGTWKDWVERADTSEYFTMDYARVQRRRPVHNKSLPARP